MKKTRFTASCLAAVITLLAGVFLAIMLAAAPATPPGNGTTLGNGTLTLGSGTATTTGNLSQSAGTLTVTGTGSILAGSDGATATAVIGSYTYASTSSLVNGQPYYSGTGACTVWFGNGTWLLTGTAARGATGTPSSALALSSSAMAPVGGSLNLTGTNTFGTLVGSATAGCTVAAGSTTVSTGVSQPCSAVVLCCTTSGALISSSSNAGTLPLPANVPLTIPVTNLNTIWVTGGTGNSIGFGYLYGYSNR